MNWSRHLERLELQERLERLEVTGDARASGANEDARALARARTAGFSLVASVVAHVGILLGGGWLAFHLVGREPRLAPPLTTGAPDDAIAIDLPELADGTDVADREIVPEGEKPSAHGGARIARVDHGSGGRGGQTTGSPAINLADADDGMRANPDLTSRLDREQHQRMRTASARASREDRRSTTHPMELTFLASGKGEHVERRPNAFVDPSRGSLVAPAAAVLGGRPGGPDGEVDDGLAKSPGAALPGQLVSSPGLGLRDGRPGDVHSAAVRIAHARPSVAEATPSIPSVSKGRPNDTVDSEQEVASIVGAQVHASFAGGVQGVGRGGTQGALPEPGAGGADGRGSIARPLGTGDGDVFDWYTNDPLLVPYFRKLHAKVDPLWRDAFPKSAMLELKQGTVILEFTIAADGAVRVSWPPARPSGIDEFDQNCAAAIRRAGPFEPLPAALRTQGRTQLKIRAPFDARNPIIK